MKPLILIFLALPLWAQLQTVNNESMPTARVKINANFTWLNSNKVGTSDSRLTDARTPLAHVHLIADITGLQTALDGKVGTSDSRLTDARTPLSHVHLIADITGLQAALDGKSATSHNHAGVYEPIDTTILRQANLAGSGSAVTPAKSDHNHTGTYEPAAGNPGITGYVWSSTSAGVRSWIANGSGGSMVYPGAGVAKSTGSAWDTSYAVGTGAGTLAAGDHTHSGYQATITGAPGTWPSFGGAALVNIGTTTGTAAAGDDARLSNARTPTSHASTHQNGGGDEVATVTPAANAIPKAGSGGTISAGWIPAANKIRAFGASFGGAGTALTAGSTVYTTVPYACTISAWNITVDTGTATVDIWKIATGTAIPTITNTITASAIPAIASGTAIHSTTLTAWATAVAANDIVGINLKVVSGATYVNLVTECDQ